MFGNFYVTTVRKKTPYHGVVFGIEWDKRFKTSYNLTVNNFERFHGHSTVHWNFFYERNQHIQKRHWLGLCTTNFLGWINNGNQYWVSLYFVHWPYDFKVVHSSNNYNSAGSTCEWRLALHLTNHYIFARIWTKTGDKFQYLTDFQANL